MSDSVVWIVMPTTTPFWLTAFGMLGTMPLVGFVEIGVAVALGVLLDTIVVRSVLVTALNLDIGPRLWWPRPLEPTAVRAGEEGELATIH